MRTLDKVSLVGAWENKSFCEKIWYFDVPTDWLTDKGHDEYYGELRASVALHQPMGETMVPRECYAEISPTFYDEEINFYWDTDYTAIDLTDEEIEAMLELTRA